MNTAENKFSTPAYRRSRAAYRWECAFEYFVTLLVADAFLASLLKDIGLSDSLIGIISSFITLAFLFQLLSVFVVQRIRNVKRFSIILHTVSTLLFMSLYLLPFLPFAFAYKRVLVIVCVLAAYLGNYLVTSMIFKWANSYVDPHHRGSYSAGKEMLSLFAGMVVTLIIGYVMDLFTESGNIHGGFVFAAVSIFIFCVCDFICLWLIDKENAIVTEKAPAVPFREVLKNTLGNRRFLYIVVLTVIWDIARYSIIGFVGTYRISELAYTVGVVQLINIAGNGVRFVISKPFGRFSDRFTYAKGASLGMLLAAIGFATLIFTTPSTRYLIIAYTVFYSVSGAGTNQNLMNITYSYVDERYFVQATAIKNSIGGIFGFGASLLAGRMLSYIQGRGNMLFGLHVYGQQALAVFALFFTLLAILFIRLVISKEKVMVQ